MEKSDFQIVKYQNEMNEVPLGDFNVAEMNLFFAICSEMKEKGLLEINFNFSELREISGYKQRGERFEKRLEELYKKMTQILYKKQTEDTLSYFVLFTEFVINFKKQTVSVSVNPKLEHILNGLTREFTQFELKEFLSLGSNYSKTLFRLLKQFKTTGLYIVKVEEFKELLSVPESYKKQSKIDQRIIDPAIKELSPFFGNLRMLKVKGKGGRIESYMFEFEPEDVSRKQEELPHVPLYNWLEEE